MNSRPTRLVVAAQVVGLVAAAGVAVWRGPDADWDLPLLAVLFAFSAISDLTAIPTSSKVKISGSFLALVLAMVLLGGAPAAAIGVGTIAIGWLRWRDRWHYLLNNVLTYACFPLIGGLAFDRMRDAVGIGMDALGFYAMVFAVFVVALAINFTMIAGYSCYLDRSSFWQKTRAALLPVLPSELAAALMAVGVAFIHHRAGLGGLAMFGVVLVTFQYLLGALLVSQERAEELARRTKQLASFQVGLLSALLHTLDLRDRMTARHSAAVARYSREIARRAGLPRSDQELVHTAALLHDNGKFIFPDRILKGKVPLEEGDWNTIRMHPHQGAQVVSQVDGYGPVAEIIVTHHERVDGSGYPNGLDGNAIPVLTRIMQVADTYDVMTARDSYREPVSSFEAIQELRRVAGTQLDPRFVEVFIEILSGKDVSYRHGEDADFDAELALEKRIHEHAYPAGDRYLAGGFSGE
jgi:putative nucleotidyltransferase with HDIG domain